ncbi:MAG: hypothetical protein ACP5HZ_05385 [Ferrimicrobium sp.]
MLSASGVSSSKGWANSWNPCDAVVCGKEERRLIGHIEVGAVTTVIWKTVRDELEVASPLWSPSNAEPAVEAGSTWLGP